MTDISIQHLGERAVVIHSPHPASELAKHLEACDISGVVDIVPAFDLVAVYFDEPPNTQVLKSFVSKFSHSTAELPNHHKVSICYEIGDDLDETCQLLDIEKERLIDLHLDGNYKCEAIGFCPGFPYLSGLNPRISGLGRKKTPRSRVTPGSIAITANMTGIYPIVRPGGWWIIGRTPNQIVDVDSDYYPITIGDTIEFERITEEEINHLVGKKL